MYEYQMDPLMFVHQGSCYGGTLTGIRGVPKPEFTSAQSKMVDVESVLQRGYTTSTCNVLPLALPDAPHTMQSCPTFQRS